MGCFNDQNLIFRLKCPIECLNGNSSLQLLANKQKLKIFSTLFVLNQLMGNSNIGKECRKLAQYCDCLESTDRFHYDQESQNQEELSQPDLPALIKYQQEEVQGMPTNKPKANKTPTSPIKAILTPQKNTKSMRKPQQIKQKPITSSTKKIESQDAIHMNVFDRKGNEQLISDISEIQRTKNTSGLDIVKLDELSDYNGSYFKHDYKYPKGNHRKNKEKYPFSNTMSIIQKIPKHQQSDSQEWDDTEGDIVHLPVALKDQKKHRKEKSYFLNEMDRMEYREAQN